jgi:D-alanyl-D-alanine carboxypeptidase/D-alanyl-D-alanine-endopeptidase (penicillin-binding protein 4)
MTILDGRTGSILFGHAKDAGLPPASSLKTITAAAALHYLGPDFTYETLLQYSGKIDTATGFLDGYIYIVGKTKSVLIFSIVSHASLIGSGDPSLGSWRYDETTTADFIIKKWIEAVKHAGIRKCRGIVGDTSRWNNTQTIIIDGWTWNDIG